MLRKRMLVETGHPVSARQDRRASCGNGTAPSQYPRAAARRATDRELAHECGTGAVALGAACAANGMAGET